ncbi:response regulator [Gordonia desulfuricans]|uniref:Transcriptional regulatory protein n=1 Tax=Gordonia desulfuricans TaxID=89051 RepID=A0A7K3LPS0_9ACTN|nr:response regulator [Gordonia desulfuricans]NDK90208.1 response regulator [Gordonia desulfuricans]
MTDTDGHGVLIVDDDFRVAALHAAIVDAVRGFHVVARAGSIAAARAALADHPEIELVLLDVYLPDGSGIDVIADLDRDCFVVGAETDADAVRTAMRAGALAYLIKPFPDTELARRLAGYAQYRRALAAPTVDQGMVDVALSALRFGTSRADRTPVSHTEQRVLDLFDADAVLFADEVAERIGISAATARRHLAALVGAGRLTMSLQYGGTGRPRQSYRRAEG